MPVAPRPHTDRDWDSSTERSLQPTAYGPQPTAYSLQPGLLPAAHGTHGPHVMCVQNDEQWKVCVCQYNAHTHTHTHTHTQTLSITVDMWKTCLQHDLKSATEHLKDPT